MLLKIQVIKLKVPWKTYMTDVHVTQYQKMAKVLSNVLQVNFYVHETFKILLKSRKSPIQP